MTSYDRTSKPSCLPALGLARTPGKIPFRFALRGRKSGRGLRVRRRLGVRNLYRARRGSCGGGGPGGKGGSPSREANRFGKNPLACFRRAPFACGESFGRRVHFIGNH